MKASIQFTKAMLMEGTDRCERLFFFFFNETEKNLYLVE